MVTEAIEYRRTLAPRPVQRPVVIGRMDSIRFRVRTEVVYDIHWLHEGAAGVLAGDFGTPCEPGLEAEADVVLRGRFVCELDAGDHGRPRLTLRSEPGRCCVEAAVVAMTGDERVAGATPPVAQAVAARVASHVAEMTHGDGVLFDGVFDFTEAGLRDYQRTRAGDLRWLESGKRAAIELQLPFLGRRDWPRRHEMLHPIQWDVTAMGRVSGRLSGEDAVVDQAGFVLATSIWLHRTGGPALSTLSHEGSWDATPAALAARAPLFEAHGFDCPIGGPATLSLSLPGEAAAAWTRTAPEDSAEFFRQFARVSLAIQRTLRQWLPAIYMSDAARLADPELAVPMMLYQYSRPYAGKYRGEYTLDPMSVEAMESAFRSARPLVKPALDRAEDALAREGRESARLYTAVKRRALLDGLQRTPRRLRALLAAELSLIDMLIGFGAECRGWGARLADPRFEPKLVRRSAARFAKALRYRLRRIYGGADYTHLSSLLLLEATAALSASMGWLGEVTAVVRGGDGLYYR